MPQTASKTFAVLKDEVEIELYRALERPATVTVSGALTVDGTSLSLSSGSLEISDLVQVDNELMAVTAGSGPYTVIRGFDGSTAATHSDGTVGYVNPRWPRHRVGLALERSLGALEAWVPLHSTARYSVPSSTLLMELPAATKRVLEVKVPYSDGRVRPVGGWEFLDNVSTTVTSTGRALTAPSTLADGTVLEVTTHEGYVWLSPSSTAYYSSPPDDASVTLPSHGLDLPVLFASAYMVSGREISQTELDSVEEWSEEAARRQGLNLRLIRERWNEFYRRVDEVRRTIQRPPARREFVKMRRGALT